VEPLVEAGQVFLREVRALACDADEEESHDVVPHLGVGAISRPARDSE
jgi:hypothetical protein